MVRLCFKQPEFESRDSVLSDPNPPLALFYIALKLGLSNNMFNRNACRTSIELGL